MRTNVDFFARSVLATIAIALACTALPAAEPPAEQSKSPERSVTVQDSHAKAVADFIRALNLGATAECKGDKEVLIRGTTDSLTSLHETIAHTLDQFAQAAGLPGARPAVPEVQQIIRLEHVDAAEAMGLIKSVDPRCRCGMDRSTNSLVVSGPQDAVAAVIAVVGQLDAQAKETGAIRTALIRLGTDVPDELLSMVKTLVSRRTEFSVDRKNGMLVLRGPAGDIDQVQLLVDKLQQAESPAVGQTGKALRLSFFFIGGQLGGTARDAAAFAKLSTTVKVEFEDVPLSEVLDSLAKRSKVDIVAVWPSLQAIGLDHDTPVTLKLQTEVSLQEALTNILEQTEGRNSGIGFSVANGLVKIDRADRLGENLAAKEHTPLPAGLEAVAAALGESGFGRPSLHAPLAVRARADGRFEVSGAINVSENGIMQAEVEGAAKSTGPGDKISLDVRAALIARQMAAANRIGNVPRGGAAPGAEGAGPYGGPVVSEMPLFEIKTSLMVKLGDYVVLAATPIAADSKEAVALALRVTAED